MADVTFGVKVSEEMKNELSLLMKEHALSGKEFMSMLLASYRLDQAKDEANLYESDIVELQNLIKRIQSIFLNMTEKSKLSHKEEQEALEKVIEAQKVEKEKVIEEQESLKKALAETKEKEAEWKKQEEALKKEIEKAQKEAKLQKTQLENNLLLHKKFEEEVEQLKERIASLERLETEIEERNNENTKLKTRNDELASEVWFLQRDIEKQTKEKEQLLEKQEKEVKVIEQQYELRLKNELLEQKLNFSEQISELKDQIVSIKEEKNELEKSFQDKLENCRQLIEKSNEKK
ncbi:MAG: hypothetical protein U0L26_08930 [Cellulosilyticum sp.]|nr:hypothetical protein [Cellulosilyticum sp.]MEE1072494.1 hypothetical protein [Cellulosilyticum sp.]